MKPLGFDSVSLAAVVDEMQTLVGGRIQKIVQTGELSFGFEIYERGVHWLTISVDPQWCRAHLSTRKPQAIKPAPELCTALRRELVDGWIEGVRQVEMDRILEIGVASPGGDKLLIAELMGRHANLIVTELPTRRTTFAAVTLGAKQSTRPILLGRQYEPPPGERATEPTSPAFRRVAEHLPDAAERVSKRAWAPHFHPEIGAYPLPFPEGISRSSISLALEQWFADREASAGFVQAQRSLAGELRRVAKARRKALAELDRAAEEAADAPKRQQDAELILAYQHQLDPGATELRAPGYDGVERVIPLDPKLSPLENAERLFKKAKKAKTGGEERGQREAQINEELSILDKLLADIDESESQDDIQAIRQEADRRGWLHRHVVAEKKEDRPYEGHSIREVTSPGGYTVLYGTSATANDYLTQRVAKPNDWWLHVRGASGSHVVLKAGKTPERVPKEDLLFAAKIAMKNSAMKHGSYVPVDYVLRKHVRKPRKAPPGAVLVTREKTLFID